MRTEAADDGADWLPLFLQTADALFPTGAYAHSLGFEEIVRLGLAHDEPTLIAFLREQILPALASLELPYLREAHAAATADDLGRLCALDAAISAWKLPREARTASAQLGTRRLRALRNVCDAPMLARMEECIARGEAAGHQLVVAGIQAAVTGTPLRAAMTAYAYQAVASVGGAALKLMRLGQDACQRAIRAAAEGIPAAVSEALLVPLEEAGCFNPLLEIAAMRHEHATERLFIS